MGKEVANSIRGAILDGKMQVIPVRRGYWGRKIGTLVSEFASVSLQYRGVLVFAQLVLECPFTYFWGGVI